MLSTAQTSFPWTGFLPNRGFVCKKKRCYLPDVQQTDTSATHTRASSPLLHRTRLPRGARCADGSYTRHGLMHVHEIPIPGVQQPLQVEVKGAEDLAKGHEPTGLLLLPPEPQQHQPEPSSHSITSSSKAFTKQISLGKQIWNLV